MKGVMIHPLKSHFRNNGPAYLSITGFITTKTPKALEVVSEMAI